MHGFDDQIIAHMRTQNIAQRCKLLDIIVVEVVDVVGLTDQLFYPL